jgi:SAM-dependent methyltransferase
LAPAQEAHLERDDEERRRTTGAKTPDAFVASGEVYRHRFTEEDLAWKAAAWDVLYDEFLSRYVRPDDVVVDLGAGACEFVNRARARRKIAVDLDPATRSRAAPDVRVLATPLHRLDALHDASVDVVFASNVFEHLPDPETFLATLREVARVLKPGDGRLLVLQPNIRLTGAAYWDFVDHRLPLTEKTLIEAAEIVGLEPVEIRARFLPYTVKSAAPRSTFLLRWYLRLRPLQLLFGKQTWFVARRPNDGAARPAP